MQTGLGLLPQPPKHVHSQENIMSPKVKRLGVILAVAALISTAVILVLGALRDNIVFFYTPSEIERRALHQVNHCGLAV